MVAYFRNLILVIATVLILFAVFPIRMEAFAKSYGGLLLIASAALPLVLGWLFPSSS